jgi:hypothetical protein
MDLAEIFQLVVIKSGQFLLKTEALELDESRFRILVDNALATYNKYCPIDRTFPLYVNSPRTYTFTSSSEPLGIPEEVVSITPTRVYGVNPYFLKSINQYKTQSENLEDRAEVPFRYEKPKLTLPFSGRYRIHAFYHYQIVETTDLDGDIVMSIPYLTSEQTGLFELVRGMFLQGIGRSRRAFTLNDMPIAMDAAELTAEGKEIEDAAMETITNAQSKMWLAYGAGK